MSRLLPTSLLPIALVLSLLGFVAAPAAEWTGIASPHDAAHLIVVKPADFRPTADSQPDAATKPDASNTKPDPKLKPVAVPDVTFGSAFAVTQPASAPLTVRHSGKYALWVRAGGNDIAQGFDVRLTRVAGPDATATKKAPSAQKSVAKSSEPKPTKTNAIEGTVLDGKGSAATGGPVGFEAFAKRARKGAPAAATDSALPALDFDDPKASAKKAASEFESELKAKNDPKGAAIDSWVKFNRLEQPAAKGPFYWWKVGSSELTPGAYRLEIIPRDGATERRAALFDAAFLSTSTESTYPFRGDFDAPTASYIRFRIDALPAKSDGITIGGGMRVHFDPWSSESVWFNPGSMTPTVARPHTTKGYTRWYRLQDVDRGPPFGSGVAHLHLSIQSAGAGASNRPIALGKDVKGATQFAIWPHADHVVREISWSDPDALQISFAPDFEGNLHLLRTLRDQAREDYRVALGATSQRLYPLTRGEPYTGNAWGAATGQSHDYMLKTLRLLGFNCAGVGQDPIRARELYGWTSQAGHYWPPAFMPFDEAAAKKQYDDYYRDFFKRDRELYQGVSIFQCADEPGEIATKEMSSPLWRYKRDGDTEQWIDVTGDSLLVTRRCDLSHCVLEGMMSRQGTNVGLGVGVDNPEKPARYVWWKFGTVSPTLTNNFAAGAVGIKGIGDAFMRKASMIGGAPTPFKIVYQGNTAALFIGDRLVHQHINVPEKGGFIILGPPKTITALKLRPIAKGEQLSAENPDAVVKADTKKPLDIDVDELLGDDKKKNTFPQAATLEEMVRKHWTAAGGMPEAHAGFRKWAAEQGLKPELFGKKTWDEVRMLSVASLVETETDAKLFYWSRRYAGYLTPKMFGMSCDALRAHAPNPEMKSFVALSGHSLYFPSNLPLDMFQLGSYGDAMMPGVSDWMSYGGWRWDSHQAVAFSVAMYNSGARRKDAPPVSHPMMHCVWPSSFRSYTMLANNCRFISYFNYGPEYAVTEGYWSNAPGCYREVHLTNNRVAQIDDLLSQANMRPSRVAMLYSMSNEYWDPQSSFADKRATFLALSHEYYQPELVTEEQIADGALENYDALVVLEPRVSEQAAEKIHTWNTAGGLLWCAADSFTRDEFNRPADTLATWTGLKRTFAPQPEETAGKTAKPAAAKTIADKPRRMSPVENSSNDRGSKFRTHVVHPLGGVQTLTVPTPLKDGKFKIGTFEIRGKYDDDSPAWVEAELGKGRIIYLGHRPGLTYTSLAARLGGYEALWSRTGREPLVMPLESRKVERELKLSKSTIMASPLTCDAGTVIILYNMRGRPAANVQMELKESAKPVSVEFFDGHNLKPLEFTYEQGAVRVTLPTLDAGQMVVVRRKPAPADPRDAAMRDRTLKQLAAKDAATLSAGAWFAGFRPAWKLEDKIAALATHENWEVRRAAAESLGRLQATSAADTLWQAASTESDAHVLAEQILALIRMGHPKVAEFCRLGMKHAEPIVREQTLEAITAALADSSSPSHKLLDWKSVAEPLANVGVSELDQRVRNAALKLLAVGDPSRLVEETVAAFGGNDKDSNKDKGHFAAAIASSNAAVTAYAEAGCPGNDALLVALASQRTNPAIAAALVKRFDQLDKSTPNLIHAGMVQHDPALARKFFERRESLPENLRPYVLLILEATFDAEIGGVLGDWSDFLAKE